MVTYNRRKDMLHASRLNLDQHKGGRVGGSGRTNPAGKQPGINPNVSKEDGNNEDLNCQDSSIQCTYAEVNPTDFHGAFVKTNLEAFIANTHRKNIINATMQIPVMVMDPSNRTKWLHLGYNPISGAGVRFNYPHSRLYKVSSDVSTCF